MSTANYTEIISRLLANGVGAGGVEPGALQVADTLIALGLTLAPLSVALGSAEARQLLRTAPTVPAEQTLAALDRAHAALHQERHQLHAARRAAKLIAAEPVDYIDADEMSVSELAGALGVRASTLRHWEAEGLVVPERWSSRRIRRYLPAHVRDARIVHQLRQAGHRIDTLRTVMPALRAGQHHQSLNEALHARQTTITRRSRALLDAAASLHFTLRNAGTGPSEPL
jgi:DNA-binding transcriptional MerR regulator